MSDKRFFDTNVLLYAFKLGDPRSAAAEQLLATGGVISVQVLNEFCSVARRKLGMNWSEIDSALIGIRDLCHEIVSLTSELHDAARKIAQRYGFHIYDSQIIAAGIEAGCTVLYSEDLQHEQMIRGLRIRNPFVG